METKRLTLRAPRPEDLPGLLALLLDPLVGEWMRPRPLPPLDAPEVERLLAEDRAHWDEHGFGPATILDRRDGGYVGRGGLKWITVAGERAVELPWAVMPSRWGEGLATEAAGAALAWAAELGLPRVVSFTLVGNGPSRRVMEKIGLALDGEIEHRGLPHVLYRSPA